MSEAHIIQTAKQTTKSKTRRKRKGPVSHDQETFTLPMPEEYSGLLIGEKGRHIIPISEALGCKIDVYHSQKRRAGCRGQSKETTVTITANEDVAMVKKALIRRSRHITKSQREQQKRSSHQAPRGQLRRDSHATLYTVMSQKEVARMTYARRCRNRRKWKIKRRAWLSSPKKDMRKKRCYHCLATHWAKLDADSCRYHPGYIKDGVVRGVRMLHWSCCQQQAAATTIQDQIYAHRNSGCSEGIHSWTLRRKKPEVKSNICPELTKQINRCGASTPTEVRRSTMRVENHARGCQAKLSRTLTITIRAGIGPVVSLTLTK